MFKKKNATQVDSPNTIIGRGIILETAKMSGKESVRIDGLLRGNIDIEGSLVLGDTGQVVGDIKARFFVAAGRVNGNVTCETTLHLASTARITGDVETKTLIVDEGSQLMGRYKVGELPADAPKSDKPERSYLEKSLKLVENQQKGNG